MSTNSAAITRNWGRERETSKTISESRVKGGDKRQSTEVSGFLLFTRGASVVTPSLGEVD